MSSWVHSTHPKRGSESTRILSTVTDLGKQKVHPKPTAFIKYTGIIYIYCKVIYLMKMPLSDFQEQMQARFEAVWKSSSQKMVNFFEFFFLKF